MVDVNLNITVPAVEMLLKYTASGIGAVAGPMLGPWRARQAATVRRIEAEAEGDSLKLIADAQAEARQSLITPDNARLGLLEIGPDGGITQRIEFQEKKRQANIASVVRDAAAELGDKEVPDHEPDHDWTARFFDCVQDVSSEDMRKLWAGILAGEVEVPGRASLRTLDILKNMTQNDAQMFRDMCDFSIDGFIFCPKEFHQNEPALEYEKIVHMRSIGLCHYGVDGFNTWTLIFGRNKAPVVRTYQNLIIKISPKSDAREISVHGVVFTDSGQDLCHIMEHTNRMDYLKSFSRFLRSKSCELSCAHILEKRPDGSVLHTNPFVPIEPKPEQSDGAAP